MADGRLATYRMRLTSAGSTCGSPPLDLDIEVRSLNGLLEKKSQNTKNGSVPSTKH